MMKPLLESSSSSSTVLLLLSYLIPVDNDRPGNWPRHWRNSSWVSTLSEEYLIEFQEDKIPEYRTNVETFNKKKIKNTVFRKGEEGGIVDKIKNIKKK